MFQGGLLSSADSHSFLVHFLVHFFVVAATGGLFLGSAALRNEHLALNPRRSGARAWHCLI